MSIAVTLKDVDAVVATLVKAINKIYMVDVVFKKEKISTVVATDAFVNKAKQLFSD